ncbi:hypothetical protein EDC01DRAFT_426795 [Geopyxis carbonaria]|nr:hypothetical protein EDC01DRAFT_426795 [Geopyxis carbonaria]
MTTFIGGFLSKAHYEAAPSPGLSIHGVPVGFPLESHTGIQLLKFRSEVQGRSLTFRNPMWQKWLITRVLPKVYIDLGIPSIDRKRVILHLENLRVQSTESSVASKHPLLSGPKRKATIAYMEVVLQSAFEGGQLIIEHGKKRSIYFAHESEFNTNVVAWYSGSSCELGPIKSGIRISLLYSLLIGPPKTPLPNSLPLPGPSQELHRAFKKFRQTRHKFAYLLKHHYSELQVAKFRLQTLKKTDLVVVSNICRIAAEYEFDVFIARLAVESVQNYEEVHNTFEVKNLFLIAGPGNSANIAVPHEKDFIQQGMFANEEGDDGLLNPVKEEEEWHVNLQENTRLYEFSAIILQPYPQELMR